MNTQKTYGRLRRAGAGLLGLALAWALVGPAGANLGEGLCEPCFSVPYFTVDHNAEQEIKSDNYRAIVTVGETELTQTVTNFEANSAALGFWSYYLTEPQPPVVTATDGDHQDRIEISWDIVDDQVGPPVTEEEVLLYRNGSILTTLPIIQTQYQDFNVFPGEEYEYAVVPGNNLGRARRDAEFGFLNPNGTVVGKVETPNGNPVADVKVVLTPNLGRSAEFGQLLDQSGSREESYVFFPELFSGLEQAYTVEGWFRSREPKEQTLFAAVDSATTRPFVRIGLTATGQLQWQHQGATAAAPDMVTARDDYTADAEWHHFAAVLDPDSGNSMTLYVDGRIVGRGAAADSVGSQKAQIVMGKKGPVEHENYLEGRLDDWRVWSAPRTRAEIRRDMDRTLEGDEGGLAAYWKFDEVKGDKLFDLTANDNDGVICKVARSNFTAPVFVSGVTDTLGNYAIKGIFYGDGTTFTATPQKVTPIGNALSFDGADDHLAFAQSRLDFGGGYTVEMWFKNPGGVNPMTLFAAADPADGGNHLKIELVNDGSDDGHLRLTHLDQVITSPLRYNDEFWYHVAATHDAGDGRLTLYVNGEAVGGGTGAAIGGPSAFAVGKQGPNIDAQFYRGWLDEIRVWNHGRTQEQVGAVLGQPLSGGETGMAAYWKLNEGDGPLAIDATGNNHTGDLVAGVGWTDDIPLNEVFTNTFEPESRQVILNPSINAVDRVDFVDISQIAVTGYAKYSGTACFIEGAEILVNGESLLPPRKTDASGRFAVEFEPGARGQRISIKYKDHDFAPAEIELPKVTRPISGLFFEDTVKREVSGLVAGGVCEIPITPTSGAFAVTFATPDGCFVKSVTPDSSGRYVADNLPPVVYNVSITHPDQSVRDFFLADTLSAADGDRERDYIYRAPPRVAIEGFAEHGTCDLRVMEMREKYTLDISVFEAYSNAGVEQVCASTSGSLSIVDDISGYGPVDISYADGAVVGDPRDAFPDPEIVDSGDGGAQVVDGKVRYSFVAGFPNITSGGDRPFQKSIHVTAANELGLFSTAEEWTYVTGNRARADAINFVSTLPSLPYMILRAPPGDQSFSFIEQGDSFDLSFGLGFEKAGSAGGFVKVDMGVEITQLYGQFVFTKTEQKTISNIKTDFEVKSSTKVNKEIDLSFTANERFQTTGRSDVYVGGAMNLLYGVTDELKIDGSQCEAAVEPNLMVLPGGFKTTFIYSENFILNTLIPNLLKIADLGREPGDDPGVPPDVEEFLGLDPATEAAAAAARESILRWNSFIEWNNSLKGQPGKLTDLLPFELVEEFASELSVLGLPPGLPVPPPPPVPLPEPQPPLPAPIPFFSRNISFDAGASNEYSETSEQSAKLTLDHTISIEVGIATELGFKLNSVGGSVGGNVRSRMELGVSASAGATNRNTVGYKLADDDVGDNFSVDILRGPLFATPLFKTVSGESSCPWERGTVARDGVQLGVSPARAVNVDPEGAAAFDLNIGNVSQTGEERQYELRVLNESNPGGAQLAVNGVFVEDALAFTVPFGEAVQAVLSVFRGPDEYDYEGLELQLASPCEYARWESGFPLRAVMADTARVAVNFTVPCSEVAISQPAADWVFTSADTAAGHLIQVTLDGYDKDHPDLDRVELQYRPASGGAWFPAGSVAKADLPATEGFVVIPWDIDPAIVVDNDYQLRAQAFCGVGEVPGSSTVASGTIDRAGPQPLGLPEPSDGILDADDAITVVFNEDINCGEISVGAGHITLTNSVTAEGIDFDYTCGGNQVVIDPNIQNVFMENLTLRASVGPVEDLLGNRLPAAVEWEFFVNRNPIEWAGLDLDEIVIFEDEVFETTRLLFNNGGSPRSFTFSDVDIATQGIALPGPRPISVPDWLTVNPREGTILPGAAQEVQFIVDGPVVGAGSYQTTLYASGGQGEEPRDVDIRVLCHPPDWGAVDPAAHQNSMTITATLTTDGDLSADEFDRVSAFIDGELRGLATVEFIPVLAQLGGGSAHQVFLTVYGTETARDPSNPAQEIIVDRGKNVELRVWDASACQELGLVLEDFAYADNQDIGTPTNPATITATSQIIRNIEFPAGWTWFSLNVNPDDSAPPAPMPINDALAGMGATLNDIVKGDGAFSFFLGAIGWGTSLTELRNESMYQIHLAQPTTLEVVGYAVDVEQTPIAVASGWNDIGFLPQGSIAVNSALATLPAKTGDIIKSQFAFAQFIEGLGWIGSLKFMNPGQGYQLYSQDPGFLQYPFSAGPAAKPVAAALPQVAALGWRLDPKRFKHSMTVTAEVVGGGALDSEQDVVAAFVGDELRGLGHTVYVPGRGRHLAFVTVYGDAAGGAPVEFSYYDAETREEGFIPTVLDFAADGIAGDIAAPLALETRERRLGDRGFVPDDFVLSPAYPNPFNPATQIGYGMPLDGEVEIAIYNVVGQKIRTLAQGFEKAGYRRAVWDGRDDGGRVVPSGVYFSLMRTAGFRATQKLMLLK